MKHNVIVVDDEVNIQRSIEMCLNGPEFDVTTFSDPMKALLHIQTDCVDIAIIDICLKNANGIEFYQELRKSGHAFPVIFISGNASLSEAAHCMKLGAYDFLEKPFTGDKLLFTMKNCADQLRLKSKIAQLEGEQAQELLGEHDNIKNLRREIQKVAKVDSAILIAGESGTGKELIAHSIHDQSQRAGSAFIKVNCSAIPESLHESALFGHIKGAFTGADSNKKGYFETANNGTIFLDEIGDMSLMAQSSLLRVLENSEIQKVGSDTITKVNVRVIAASHKNLKKEVEQGNFREDLFYRLNVIPLISPPLRERASDIPLLATHLINKICHQHGLPTKEISPDCFPVFQRYSWPGNVRELTNTIERMIIMSGPTLTKDDIPLEVTKVQEVNTFSEDNISLREFKQRTEREFIITQLKKHGGNISRLAKSLEVDRTNLHKKMTQLDIKRENLFR